MSAIRCHCGIEPLHIFASFDRTSRTYNFSTTLFQPKCTSVSDGSDSKYLKSLTSAALAFCQRPNSPPRLVAANSWLRLSLQPQVSALSAPKDVAILDAAPDGQHVLICATDSKEVDVFHLASKNYVRSFQGEFRHSFLCLTFF